MHSGYFKNLCAAVSLLVMGTACGVTAGASPADGGQVLEEDVGHDGGAVLIDTTDIKRVLCSEPEETTMCGFTQDFSKCPGEPPATFAACGPAVKAQCSYCYAVRDKQFFDTWLCGSKGWRPIEEYISEICNTADGGER